MKRDTKRIAIITILIMVSILTILFVSKELINKNKVPEKSSNNITENKRLAIMVTNDNGIGYKEYEGEKWPEGYSLAKSECVDNNGNKVEEAISYDESTNKVTLKTKRTVYCTLYFDKDTILNTLRKNDPNEVISKELVGDLYRYQGLDKQYSSESKKIVDNNYICFGTTNKSTCLSDEDKYVYRIIGISNKEQMYLLKETLIKESGTLIRPQWNNIAGVSQPYIGTDFTKCDGENCEWPKARLYKRINGISNGTTKGDHGNTNIFLGTTDYPSSYEYLTEGTNWYNLIENHSWMYGDTTETVSYNGDVMYAIETGTRETKRNWLEIGQTCSSESLCPSLEYTWSKSVDAKIGLMYMHDYFYAYLEGNSGSPTTGSPTNVKKSWIFFQNNSNNAGSSYEWLLPRRGLSSGSSSTIDGWVVDSSGGFGGSFLTFNQRAIRPVFYLLSTIKIKSGTGTESDPYILDVKEV